MRLCKDCQLLAHLSPADINILYQTEARAAGRALDGRRAPWQHCPDLAGYVWGEQVKRSARKVQLVANSQAKRENPNMLTHSDFLNLLLRISGRIYPVS